MRQEAAMYNCVLCAIFLMTSLVCGGPVGARTGSTLQTACTARGIAVYNVIFQTFWTRELFPKQYPMFRPHAQWSRLVGRSHDEAYTLWRKNSTATPALKAYAETGDSTLLDLDRQGHNGVYDVFGGSNINSGEGTTSTAMFADARHSKVSLVSHLVPSPDWFVGLDSVDLCQGSSWIKEQLLDLSIWDAGTDKGYTFTAPNWAEIPQLPISQITSSIPDHPANGFYYEEAEKLPTIARVMLILDKEMDVAHKYEPQRDWQALKGEMTSGSLEAQAPKNPSASVPTGSNTVADNGAGKTGTSQGATHDTEVAPPMSQPQKSGQSNTVGRKDTIVGAKEVANTEPIHNTPVHNVAAPREQTPKLSKAERRRLRRQRNQEKKEKKNRRNRGNKRKGKAVTEAPKPSLVGMKRKDTDCEVSAWTEWSACSKTCGYGNRTRVRTVVQSASGRGRKCPALTEEELCGSMRGCGWSHFGSNSWGNLG